MVSQRNRVIEVINYLETLGIKVNWGKNKARGNNGFFRASGNNFRIDIAKNLTEEAALKVLIHEFSHFVHYKYDKTLKTLDFITDKESDELTEELIELTVHSIPKKSIAPLFEAKEKIKADIKSLNNKNCIELEIQKRALRSINAKINRLNKYYNSPTELFARSMEIYMTDRELFTQKAPALLAYYDKAVIENQIPLLSDFNKIFLQIC